MQLCTARLHPKGTSSRCALRAPRLLRSLAMTNLGVLSSRVIARRAQARRGNLKQAVTNPPEAFLCSGRCCEIATAPLGPRNDKSGSIAPLNSCHQYCQPAWRSLSAATDAIGAYHFIGSHYESTLPTIIVSLVYSKITALPDRFRQRGSSCQKSPFGLFRQAAFRIAK